MEEKIFPIIPASSGAGVWLMVTGVIVVLILGGLLTYIAYSTRHAQFIISSQGLRVRNEFYGRLIPASGMHVEQARIVKFEQEPGMRLKFRSNGTALPGYWSGWYRLKSDQKALVFLTSKSEAVLIPTTSDYVILVNPQNPEEFIRELRKIGSAGK